jgi:hypothetical protein
MSDKCPKCRQKLFTINVGNLYSSVICATCKRLFATFETEWSIAQDGDGMLRISGKK